MPSIGSFGVAKRIIEQVDEPATFEFCGQDFRIVEGDPSTLPLMEFADAAANGLDSGDAQGLAAMWRMLRDCLHPDDWPNFRRVAMDNKASTEDVLAVVGGVWEYLTGRPTRRPTDSPGGPQKTSTSSKGISPPSTDQPSDASTATQPERVSPRGAEPTPELDDWVPSPMPGWPPLPPGRTDLAGAQVLMVDEAVL